MVNSVGGAASGTLELVALNLVAGDVVTSLTFVSGATAGATLTNCWFSLYSAALSRLGVTADDTASSWAATTARTLALASAYVVPASGLYYAGKTIVGGTVPSFVGAAGFTVTAGMAPILSGTSNTSLTTPGTAPATASALTAVGRTPYCYLS